MAHITSSAQGLIESAIPSTFQYIWDFLSISADVERACDFEYEHTGLGVKNI